MPMVTLAMTLLNKYVEAAGTSCVKYETIVSQSVMACELSTLWHVYYNNMHLMCAVADVAAIIKAYMA